MWPQGHDTQWGVCGSEWEKCEAANNAKSVHKVDDLEFLTKMITYIVKVEGSRVDPEQVFATGFSMGCMMSQRLALERSKIVAGFGCHGGTLMQIDTNLTSQVINNRETF